MLAALLCNQPYTGFGSSQDYRRRPNEKVVWHDEWLKAQEELTAFKQLSKGKQRVVARKAIKEVKASVSPYTAVVDAKEIIIELQTINAIMAKVENINALILAYYWLEFEKQRSQDDIAAMLLLGVL